MLSVLARRSWGPLLLTAGLALVVSACGTDAASAPTVSATAEQVASATEPTLTDTPAPTPYPYTTIPIAGGVGKLLWAAGSVWATGPEEVTRIDAVTDEVVAVIPVDGRPHGLAADGLDVWVTVGECSTPDPGSCDDGELVRIDADTNDVVQTIPIGTWGYAIAIANDTLWVSSFEDGLVVRVDPVQGRVVTEISVADPTGIVAGSDGVWTPRHYTGLVAQIDPESNAVTELNTGTLATEFVALTDDAVWVTTGDRSLEVVVLSRQTGEVVGRIPAAWPQGVVVHEGTVWVALSGRLDPPLGGGDSGIIALDAQTLEVVAEYPLPYTGVSELATDGKSLWVPGSNGLLKLNVGG